MTSSSLLSSPHSPLYSSKHYLVTELLGGGELFDAIIKKEHYAEEDARLVMVAITEALNYCHERGVVHRDLKVGIKRRR